MRKRNDCEPYHCTATLRGLSALPHISREGCALRPDTDVQMSVHSDAGGVIKGRDELTPPLPCESGVVRTPTLIPSAWWPWGWPGGVETAPRLLNEPERTGHVASGTPQKSGDTMKVGDGPI